LNISRLVDYAINNNGVVKPIIIPADDLSFPALTNPSIAEKNGELYMCLRNMSHTLFHAENDRFHHILGKNVLCNKEDENIFTTHNYICKLNNNLTIEDYFLVDTSANDVEPLWQFIGLEDARLVFWNNKSYLCGTRRDTTTNGVARIEMSEVEFDNDECVEISRVRIPLPGNEDSYCEKNWMPILHMPYHFVKWSNPVQIVKTDQTASYCENVHMGSYYPMDYDWRGGGQIIEHNNYYYGIIHESVPVATELNKRDLLYYHKFIVWDKSWDLVTHSKRFTFTDSLVEFACGLCKLDQDVYISFGQTDLTGYVLKLPITKFESFIHGH
jgi:hypothetical protein